MGAVYMAYDNSLDVKVAVKVISPQVLNDEGLELYEAALLRFRIDHPNVIRVLPNTDSITRNAKSVVVDDLVMEWLAERNLRHTMDKSGFETKGLANHQLSSSPSSECCSWPRYGSFFSIAKRGSMTLM